jgi:hypothetical protein
MKIYFLQGGDKLIEQMKVYMKQKMFARRGRELNTNQKHVGVIYF